MTKGERVAPPSKFSENICQEQRQETFSNDITEDANYIHRHRNLRGIP